MKKRNVLIILGLLLAIGLFYAGRSVYYEYYPVPKEPSAEWEPFVRALDAKREAFFIEVDGINLEAELFIPNGGKEQKPAVLFAPGSGDQLYQNYNPGFIETYILDLFLSKDMAVLLVNKRGMGLSEGLYTSRSIEGRAEDVLASVETIQTHPRIDASNIGLVGHSQGGWVVVHAAAENPDIAFFISLAGPTTTIYEQTMDRHEIHARCIGLSGAELDEYLAKQSRSIDLGMKIGEITNFGMLGFDYRSMHYKPDEALKRIDNPGMYIFGENDPLVPPSVNIERLQEIFDNDVPQNLSTAEIDDADHAFVLTKGLCDHPGDSEERVLSQQLGEVIHDWLSAQGY